MQELYNMTLKNKKMFTVGGGNLDDFQLFFMIFISSIFLP